VRILRRESTRPFGRCIQQAQAVPSLLEDFPARCGPFDVQARSADQAIIAARLRQCGAEMNYRIIWSRRQVPMSATTWTTSKRGNCLRNLLKASILSQRDTPAGSVERTTPAKGGPMGNSSPTANTGSASPTLVEMTLTPRARSLNVAAWPRSRATRLVSPSSQIRPRWTIGVAGTSSTKAASGSSAASCVAAVASSGLSAV